MAEIVEEGVASNQRVEQSRPDTKTTTSYTTKTIGRQLYGKATLWQDWDDEEAVGSSKYWELFTDLILVAAASAVADTFKEEPTRQGLDEFVVSYVIVVQGWLLYTHHYTSRFEDWTLLHNFILFFYLLGMAGSIINVGKETAFNFSCGIIMQRGSILVMMILIWFQIPKARHFVIVKSTFIIATILFHVVVVVDPEGSAMYAWTACAVLDFVFEAILVFTLPGTKLVPVNIDHTTDRLNVLALVMLGEAVISLTVTYRDSSLEAGHEQRDSFFGLLALSFLMIFMFTLLFFNMQPPAHLNALRRSRFAATTLLLLFKLLGIALLTVGVYIKLAVIAFANNVNDHVVEAEERSRDLAEEDMKEDQDLENEEKVKTLDEGEEAVDLMRCPFVGRLIGYGVGFSMLILYGMRMCHYFGKLPYADHPPKVKNLMYVWWVTFCVLSFVPFTTVLASPPLGPEKSMSIHAAVMLLLCLIESSCTHILAEYLPSEYE